MIMPRNSSLLAILAAAISLSACSYDCGVVSRTAANGTVRDAGNAELAAVQVSVSEYLHPSFLRLSVGIMGPAGSSGAPLRNHVTSARLVTESGALLAEIPTSTETLYADAVVALNVDLSSREEYARVRSALLTRRAKVILETDLPGREHIETTLSDANDVPGQVQRCSPA
jgi:hypothetical protein